jgi:hypothetical protein
MKSRGRYNFIRWRLERRVETRFDAEWNRGPWILSAFNSFLCSWISTLEPCGEPVPMYSARWRIYADYLHTTNILNLIILKPSKFNQQFLALR